MALEQYKNNGQTTLNNGGVVTSGATSFTVTDGSVFPATGNFRVKIENEIMIVTSRSTNVLTVTRGAEGTSAASHADGSAVNFSLTAAGLKNLSGNLVQTGAYASIPAAGQEGNLYLPNDGVSLYRDSGSLQKPWGPLFPMVAPINGDYAWVNQGSAVVDATLGGITLSAAAGAGSDQLRCRVKTVPTAPYTLVVAFIPMFPFPSNFNACGILLRDSGSGKIVTVAVASDSAVVTSGQIISIIKWTSATAFSGFYTPAPTVAGSYASLSAFQSGPCLWFKIVDDNTNRILSVSQDGVLFHQLHTIGRTDFLTPDQLGFFVNQQNATYGVAMNVLSWKES